jgi:hypothetical protein
VPEIQATVVTTITAADDAAFQEALRHSGLLLGGDSKTRIVRTAAVPAIYRQTPWSVSANWTVRIPRSASLRLTSYSSRTIRVSNLLGNVRVNNFNGSLILNNLQAATIAESVNGSIIYNTPQPRGNVLLVTVNGSVNATIAGNADVRWIAKTMKCDIRTSLPARGTLF